MIAAHLSVLNAALRAAGADYPKAVKKAFTDRDALRSGVAPLAKIRRADVIAAAADAILAGTDPLTDRAVVRLGIASLMTGDSFDIELTMTRHADDRIAAVLTTEAPAVLDSLRSAALTHGRALTDAHAILGDTPLSSSATILSLGPVAAEAWAAALRSSKAVNALDAGWVALADLTRFANPSALKIHRLADVSLDDRERLGHNPDVWTLVQAGATIDLATAETLATREARMHTERATRQVVADRASDRATSVRYGFAGALP